MKYPKIESLVPEKEFFDASAVGDGVWLTVGHLNGIESALENAESNTASALVSLEQNLNEVNASSDALKVELEAAKETVVEKDSTITTQAAKIVELETKVAELGGQSSGAGGSNTNTPGDAAPIGGATAKISFDSPEHPANKLADQVTRGSNTRSI